MANKKLDFAPYSFDLQIIYCIEVCFLWEVLLDEFACVFYQSAQNIFHKKKQGRNNAPVCFMLSFFLSYQYGETTFRQFKSTEQNSAVNQGSQEFVAEEWDSHFVAQH